MRKNTIMRIAAVVLMCTLVTACFASSTFAKYTAGSQVDTNTVTVAKWDIVYGENQKLAATPAPSVTFDLFKTINHHHTGDVATKVAPGTWGEFKIDAITNKSEVAAQVGVKVTGLTTNNIPIKFYKTKGGTTEAPTFSDKVTVEQDTLLVNQELAPNASTTAQTIYWVWDFSANGDANDTALGTAATAPTYTITLQINADQLD